MKTYTKTVEQTLPRLVIEHEDCPESPRTWDNLGYFITVSRKSYSPDKNEEMERIIAETGEEANTQKEHMAMIKRRLKNDMGEKVIAIYPVNKYEHSGVTYSLGTVHGFDNSNNGFYIITKKSAELIGTPKNKKAFERVINGELETFNAWVNGDVYCYTSYDKNGEVDNSCCGFYDLEDIKADLGKEWSKENMRDYLKY